jgi:uncharacterized repeat protein (TIGR03803 family)
MTEKILHSFNFNRIDGTYPYATLIFDASGNLYGTTSSGGAGTCGTNGCGTVFELLPQSGGAWTERILYSFKNNGIDGFGPLAGVVFDSSGNLYGTTSGGGAFELGTVFELSPKAGGGWGERLLHTFHYDGKTFFDGSVPYARLVVDTAGNLYGTTNQGGGHGFGTVFEVVHTAGGGWALKTLHSFNPDGTDGIYPFTGVVFDKSGNLCGATYNGGAHGYGSVFELTPQSNGSWSETIVHSFNQDGTDGTDPYGGVVLDAAGNIFGTTANGGGARNPSGTVFELTPSSGGWTENVLYSFDKTGTSPEASLVLDSAGNLYGTTRVGGAFNYGTVFEITP